ncbi:MAG TPA: CotH kinase family protein, partial [Verrucomicrobiae bacterium]|nr:CotH kinase family protein [Verrucomicrobiae bacterium]
MAALLWAALFACRAEEAPLSFDHPAGLYSGPFDLKIETGPDVASMRVTLDGSVPGKKQGKKLAGPLRINGTTVVRAAAHLTDGTWSAPVTRTFIFPAGVARQTGENLPASWGVDATNRPVPAAYAMRLPPDVQRTGTARIEQALQSLPTLSITLPTEELFGASEGIYAHSQESGKDWERAASVEFIPTNGTGGFAVEAGLRIHGGWSRRPEESPKHGFRIYFRKKYGTGELNYPLFGGGLEKHTLLVLRGGNNNTWLHPESAERKRAEFARDSWMRSAHAAMGYPAARDRFVHLYLNGLYWGVYDLAERPDAGFCAERLGGAGRDYDALSAGKVISGDDGAWKALFAAANHGVERDTDYARIGELLDLTAYADFILLNLYGAND